MLQDVRGSPSLALVRRAGQTTRRPHGDHSADFRQVLRQTWAAYHSLRRIWATPDRVAANVRILHDCMYPCFSWAAGTRHWTQWKLGHLRTAQTRMAHGVAYWHPRRGEEFPGYAERAAALARSLWTHGGARLGQGQRGGGVGQAMSQGSPSGGVRGASRVVALWQGVWCMKTVRYSLWREGTPTADCTRAIGF